MAITSLFKVLSFDSVEAGDNILETWLTRAFQAVNALYEGTIDSAAVGKTAGSQLWEGHDHGPGGGPAMQRGCLYSIDGGSSALFTLALTAKTPQDMTFDQWYTIPGYFSDVGRFFVSPRVTGPLQVWVCYDCVDSPVIVKAREAAAALSDPDPVGAIVPVTLDKTTDSAESPTYQWALLQMPCSPGRMNALQIECESETDATFQVYSIVIAEVEGLTVNSKGVRL